MHFFVRRLWDVPESRHTPVDVYRRRRWHRREFLKWSGLAATASLLPGCPKATDEEVAQLGRVEAPAASTSLYPALRNAAYEYGRDETEQTEAARYTNFYEFAASKDVFRYVSKFETSPWTLAVDGLCNQPRKFDLDDLHALAPLEERAYRHRCVETWAMCVPWTGFPLAALIAAVDPKPSAKYVAFETFMNPQQAASQENPSYPWPYGEGLTLAELRNELAFVATGIYGEPLPKQHGAPVRIVLPWKYGYKSAKSLVRITLTDKEPPTFWSTLMPHEYDFVANVDPEVPHPRWSQRSEWMLGTMERFETKAYNGYGELVGELYA